VRVERPFGFYMARQEKRFVVSSPLKSDQERAVTPFLLTPSETHHLKNVLRMEKGSTCQLVDLEGHEVAAKVKRFLGDGRTEVEFMGPVTSAKPLSFCLTVAQAVPQHRKMDQIAEKAAELGIFEVIPLVTERTVVRMESEKGTKAVARWQRIAEQTVKQSRLSHIPQILPFHDFHELCSAFERFDKVLLLHPKEDDKSFELMKFLSSEDGKGLSRALLIIGPEGGFSPAEVKRAREAGAAVAYLKGGILKTDTAFVLAAGMLTMRYQ